MPIEQQSTQEIAERLSTPDRAIELHREAIDNQMTLSRYLEAIDPSEENSRLDAFGRQLRQAGIVTRSNPAAGWWASEASSFLENTQSRALMSEFYARNWRQIMFASREQKRAASIMLSSDAIVGAADRPWPDIVAPQWTNQFQPAIPLTELVARTTPISGEDYRSLYMTYDAEALRLFRIGESAEIPVANLVTSGRSIRLRKYGRGLRATYEQLRRTRVDKFAWWAQWQALQSEVDKVTAAMDYLVSGDGNAGTGATSIDLTDLDPTATPGTLTLTAWLNFRMQFTQPYTLSTALMNQDVALQLIQLNVGNANLPLAGYDFAGIGNRLVPINTTADGIRYGWTADAPASKIIGFDNRFALEQLTEIGSDIKETERFINNQTELMVMTENSAFAVMDATGTKILNLAA